MVHYVEYQGLTGYYFQIKLYFLSRKIVFVLANSVNPDEMPHYAAFHLGLHCLPKYSFRSHQLGLDSFDIQAFVLVNMGRDLWLDLKLGELLNVKRKLWHWSPKPQSIS